MKRRFLSLALVALLSTSAATTAFAIETPKNPETVRYVGDVNNLPIYQVLLNNTTDAAFIISIKDEEGNMLHSEKVQGKNIVRNYQLAEVPATNYSLHFEVLNTENKKQQIYTVNKTIKVVEKVAVEKVK